MLIEMCCDFLKLVLPNLSETHADGVLERSSVSESCLRVMFTNKVFTGIKPVQIGLQLYFENK